MVNSVNLQKAQRASERAKYNRRYFRSHYWAEDLPGGTGNGNLSYDDPDHLGRFSFLSSSLISNVSFETVLDAGCGTGLLLPHLAEGGKEAVGIDVSEDASAIYDEVSRPFAKKPPFIVGSLDSLPFSDRSFDLTWCSDVMEHIPVFDVQVSISELTRVTRRSLILTINVDNPYEYHPTILSRATWEVLLLGTGLLVEDGELRDKLQKTLGDRHPEYTVFAYTRM